MARTPTPRPVRRIQADIDRVKKNIAGCEKIIYKRNTAGGLRSTIFIASTGKEVATPSTGATHCTKPSKACSWS